jgi:hypothetical protein
VMRRLRGFCDALHHGSQQNRQPQT